MTDIRRNYIILAAVLAVLGVLALIGGILYLTETANKLPSFMPGHLSTLHIKRTKRGTAGLVAAGVLFVLAAASALVGGKGSSDGAAGES